MSHLVCNQLKKVFIFLEEKIQAGSIPAHFIINEREFFVKKEGMSCRVRVRLCGQRRTRGEKKASSPLLLNTNLWNRGLTERTAPRVRTWLVYTPAENLITRSGGATTWFSSLRSAALKRRTCCAFTALFLYSTSPFRDTPTMKNGNTRSPIFSLPRERFFNLSRDSIRRNRIRLRKGRFL